MRRIKNGLPRQAKSIREILLCLSVAASLFALLSIFLFEHNRPIMSMTLTHTAFIAAPNGEVITPHFVATSRGGNIIVAGTTGNNAWAAATDQKGKVLWQYFSKATSLQFDTDYHAIAPMPDGSVYLCGQNLDALGILYSPVLITHLDAQGHLLSEQLIVPKGRPDRGIARLNSCVARGDEVVIQGRTLDWTQMADGKYSENNLYWLFVLYSEGNMKWEKNLPIASANIASGASSPLMVTENGDLIFAYEKDYKTELVKTDKAGNVIIREVIDGGFQFVAPVVEDSKLQIIGHRSANELGTFSLISLNDQLVETDHDDFSEPYLLRLAYRKPDQRVVLFGSETQRGPFTIHYTSALIELSRQMWSRQHLVLPHSPLIDGGSVWAAAPTKNPDEFVSARSVSVDRDLNDRPRDNGVQVFNRGVELDFVTIQ